MVGVPGNPPSLLCSMDAATIGQPIGDQSHGRTWYFSKEEIEDHTPSRMDGIDYMQESFMRDLCCSFLGDLASKLQVGSATLATALMLCHRFFMRQSLAKNDWQIVAASSMFLASKIEDKILALKNIVVMAYELMYKWDPSAPKRIRQRDVLSKQRELILNGEQLILVTIAFDINIEHPYEPLMAALKMLKLSENHVARTAWHFVSYGLRSTLCLQYKPHYLAAAALFLAAKLKNVKLPMDRENVWWLKFNVTPKQLQEAIKDMNGILDQRKEHKSAPRHSKAKAPSVKTPKTEPKNSATLSSPSCIPSGSTLTHEDTVDTSADTSNHLSLSQSSGPGDNLLIAEKQASEYVPSDCSSANSVVEDSEATTCLMSARDSKPETVTGHVKLDVARLREALRRTRSERDTSKRKAEAAAANNVGDGDSWVARELERGVEQEYGLKLKQQKVELADGRKSDDPKKVVLQ